MDEQTQPQRGVAAQMGEYERQAAQAQGGTPVAAVPYHPTVADPPPPPQPIRRMPRRIVEVTLPAPYDDFHVTGWVNFPKEVADDLNSNDEERTRRALMQIVRSHDLVDYEGQPYPPADDPALWDVLPNDVARTAVKAVTDQIGKLDPKPKSS